MLTLGLAVLMESEPLPTQPADPLQFPADNVTIQNTPLFIADGKRKVTDKSNFYILCVSIPIDK
jgi:hypothetical protein